MSSIIIIQFAGKKLAGLIIGLAGIPTFLLTAAWSFQYLNQITLWQSIPISDSSWWLQAIRSVKDIEDIGKQTLLIGHRVLISKLKDKGSNLRLPPFV